MPRVALYTLGCKVSQYETEAVAERFADLGFEVVSARECADVYVINTCTVTGESDRKSRQVIRRLRAKSPDAVIGVMGCYSQRSAEEVSHLPVDIIIGTDGKMKLPELVLDMLADRGLGQTVSVSSLSLFTLPSDISYTPGVIWMLFAPSSPMTAEVSRMRPSPPASFRQLWKACCLITSESPTSI